MTVILNKLTNCVINIKIINKFKKIIHHEVITKKL